jgi:ribose 5-phosphate isomerase A
MANDREREKELAAREAVKLIRNGQVVGLGTGSTAYYAVKAIGERVTAGLQITGVPTSEATKNLAAALHIPLMDISLVEAIDITIDGADEFTPGLALIKGGGGALLKEKVVASLTKEEIIITDSSKQVAQLGKFTVPVEVIPYAANYILSEFKALGGRSRIRRDKQDQIHITEEGNYIIDTDFGLIEEPARLSDTLNGITGVVAHGLFVGLASKVIMGRGTETVQFVKA